MMWNWVCEIVDTQTGEIRTIIMQDDLTKIAKWEKELAQKDNEVKTWKVGIKLNDVKAQIPFVDGLTDIQGRALKAF